jgi:hypothetical protein
MAEDQGKEEEKFDFTGEGEAVNYISLAQAGVLAMQTARETPGEYGSQYQGVSMAFEVSTGQDTEDYYIVTLSFRPQGNFSGRPGQEQFFVEKEGTVAIRQVLSLPTGGGRRFPVLPVAIGLVIVGLIVALAVVVAVGRFGDGGGVVAVAAPTETSVSIVAEIPPTDTPIPPTHIPTPTLVPTATPTAVPTATPTPVPTATPRPTYTPFPTPTATPRPTPTARVSTTSYIPRPAVFGGSATLNGSSAPNGTIVTALIDGASAATTSTIGGNYAFAIAQPQGRSYEGKEIRFGIGGFIANEVATWTNDGGDILNLTATSVTPTPTLVPTVTPIFRTPPRPAVFGGSATLNGSPAPNGTIVTALIDGAVAATAHTDREGYRFAIAQPPGRSYEGKTIRFRIGGFIANQVATWTNGGGDILNLTAG